MFYKQYNVRPEWIQQVKNDPFLTEKEKRSMIKSAKHNANVKTFKSVFSSMLILMAIALVLICLGIIK